MHAPHRTLLRTLAKSAAILCATLFCAGQASAQNLAKYNVKIDETSVSGISSGANMAVQFGVAYSSLIKGVGATASGPYYCARGSSSTALGECMVAYPAAPATIPLRDQTNTWSSGGQIDNTSNLAKQKIWMFNGYNDGVVKRQVQDKLLEYYQYYINPGNIYYKTNIRATHSHVTNTGTAPCDAQGGNYVNNCNYDSAGMILQHIYGRLNAPTSTPGGTLTQFSQREFYTAIFGGSDTWLIGMLDNGYVYVPASCAGQQPCRVHVALHGCNQSSDVVGNAFYAKAGYNEWADTNNIIVLYPQTKATSIIGYPTNPYGCWDWWGYNSSNYATKSGAQIRMFKAMLDRLSGLYNASTWTGPGGSFGAPANVAATDSSHNRASLRWSAVAGARGYNIYRRNCSTCSFAKVNTAEIKSPSFGDSGLSSSTTYGYKVRAVNSSGTESADSAIVSRATAATPASCDPYLTSNYDHWLQSRAYTNLPFNTDIFANGSGQWMGFTGPTSMTTYTFLRRTGTNFYNIGVCS